MKHSLLHIALVSSVLFTNFTSFHPSVLWTKLLVAWNHSNTEQIDAKTTDSQESIPAFEEKSENVLVAGPAAQVNDSLILVDLYNSTTVSLPWNFGLAWNFGQPVCEWNGVTLDSEGYVTHIVVPSVGMNGTLPNSIGGLSRLIELTVGGNRLTGSIPSTIGQLSELEILKVNDNFGPTSGMNGQLPAELGNLKKMNIMWLDGNRFTDTLPKEMGRMSNLNTLFLDENEFTGTVPDSFIHLTNLGKFDIYDNQFDSLPDLSGITSLFLQTNKFKIRNNKFTFDDILPNIGTTTQDFYYGQDSIFEEQTVSLFTGMTYRIDLGIDSGISDNSYQWFRNGLLYGPPLNVNYLDLTPVDMMDAGVYHCQVTNPGADELILYSRAVTIQVQCGTSVNDINDQICQGDEIIINGTPYNCNNLTGTEFLPGDDQFGCDSIINVNLTCSLPITIDSMSTLCSGDSLIVNGEVYNENNDEGWEVVNNGMGCDTTIHVLLSFYTTTASSSLNTTICRTDSVVVNNVVYKFGDSSGTEVLQGMSATGCDSTVNVDLNFYPEATGVFDQMLCTGGAITVNNILYDAGNPIGFDTIYGGAMHGCDSLIVVDLSFGSFASSTQSLMFCAEGSYEFNNITYTDDFMVVDTMLGAGANGCDSLVFINGDFIDENRVFFAPFLCAGDTVHVNGTIYGPSPTYPSVGTETFSNIGPMGCDSIVEVILNFFPATGTGIIEQTLCNCDPFVFNGTTYDCNNPSGTEIVEGVAANGCDSTYQIDLSYFPDATGDFNPSVCEGGSITYNGTVYNAGNPSGTETISNASPEGCDSIISVQLSFFPTTGDFNPSVCEGGSITYNGTVYNAGNPSGTEIIPNASPEGCDSTISVQISFFSATGNFNPSICEGGSITYNGTVYNAGNPSGTEIIPNASPEGCDSTISVQLSFITPSPGDFNPSVCEGETFEYNGTLYDVNNPCGTEILTGEGLGGCDSTVNFCLSFFAPTEMGFYTETICPESDVMIGGQTFSQAFPMDTVVIGNDSNGCDSLVEVTISFFPEAQQTIDTTICAEASFMVNGTLYGNGGLISGTETIPGGSANGCALQINVNVNNFNITPGNFTPTICVGDNFIYNGTLYGDGGINSGTELIPGSEGSCDSMVNVNVLFHPVSQIGVFAPTICATDDVTYNGTTYNAASPTGTETLVGVNDQYGCDSVVQVQISFHPDVVNNINQTLCAGTSILVNGVLYNEGNPSGSETIMNGTVNGCDSVVNVDLLFNTFVENNIVQTLCDCDTVVVNNVIYDCNNSTGAETILGGSYIGCDSIINVDLSYMMATEVNFTPTLCAGETVIINGTLYSEAMSSGTEIFNGGTNAGCDSTVLIDIDYLAPIVSTINTTVCDGEVVMVNGMSFTPDNTPFTEVIDNGSFTGCDSSVVITVAYFPEVINNINQMLCTGETIVVNGTTYGDGANLSGTEIIIGGSNMGCDSTIMVDLTIASFVSYDLDPTLCEDEFEIVNGNTYDITTPTGQEIFPNGSIAGCDSIVNINLSFFAPTTSMVNPTFCECTNVIVNGTTYDCDNPNGTELLENFRGCDSLITIALNFLEPVVNNYTPIFCPSETEVINGTLYFSGNPSGTEVIGGGSSNGCDSTIVVNLQFFEASLNEINPVLCPTEDITINGTLFNIGNPGGTMVLEGQNFQGCDSTIVVALQFLEEPNTDIAPTLCAGESITVDGVVYDEGNPTGIVVFESAGSNGCDSTVNINLDFHLPAISTFAPTLCEGESVVINGNTYDFNQPTGTEILTAASSNGCDSTINIALAYTATIINELTAEICSGNVFTINNVTYSTTGSFSETIIGGSSQGCDSMILLNLTVLDAATLGLADAGTDANECLSNINLNGNTPNNTTGVWTSPSGAIIDQETDANTLVDLLPGENIFIWTLSSDVCPNYDTDTMVIQLEDMSPIATDDVFEMPNDSVILNIDLLVNDDLDLEGDWTVELLAQPESGTLITGENLGQFIYQPIENFVGGMLNFSYQICNNNCPELCDSANVSINVEALNIDLTIEIPSGITPNDDGSNDYFVIPEIQNNPEEYSNSELIIYNRWGDIVYAAKPYNNDWNGRSNGGKELPQGTYYYLLRVDFSEGKIYKGDVTILK